MECIILIQASQFSHILNLKLQKNEVQTESGKMRSLINRKTNTTGNRQSSLTVDYNKNFISRHKNINAGSSGLLFHAFWSSIWHHNRLMYRYCSVLLCESLKKCALVEVRVNNVTINNE